MNDDGYNKIRAEVAALSGDALREYLADMMGRSVAAGAVPRAVILKRLATVPDEELRAGVLESLDIAERIERETVLRGYELAIAYDAEELARVQAEQRKLKE